MHVRVKQVEGQTWMAVADSGHAVVMDAAPDIGGHDRGMRPMEMVLSGLCGCTAIDVLMILQKQRQSVSDVVVEAQAERAAEPPKVFTTIHLVYRVSGRGLKRAAVERAVRLSSEKYCSVSAMLRPGVVITDEVEIIEVDPAGLDPDADRRM
ncbi:MAG: OsmC family protein [bacterium]|nr:OsmC family protein [Myxococcales bacterium]MCB9553171.1 OsmC family protein [Myxococcales bacterium]